MLRRSLSVTILQYWSYNMAVFLPYGNVLDYFHDTCISLFIWVSYIALTTQDHKCYDFAMI